MDKEKTKQRWTEYCSEQLLYKVDGQDYTAALGTSLSIFPPQLNDALDNILYAGRKSDKTVKE